MTEVPPETPAENIAEETPPTEAPDPEEYAPTEPVSDDTGTVYDGTGQAAATPQDLEPVDEEDED